jgi:hypothetical protein
MSFSPKYLSHFYEVLRDSNVTQTDLPIQLQELIEVYESAKDVWNRANEGDKRIYLDAIIKSDALISALIINHYESLKNSLPPKNVSDAKLKELKIKALKLKYNLSQLKK